MSIDRVIGFVRGYVMFFAEGLFCERFLNICMRRGIYLWEVRRMGENRICACISVGGFKEIRSIARKTRTHISISKKYGLPFLLHRYRKRKALIAGAALFFALLWYLTTHITGISVVGNTRIATEDIIKELQNCGVYYGASVNKINDEIVKNRMMNGFDDIAWIGINIKGSRAYIEVRERLDTKVSVDRDIPCDIVAARGGTVKLLEVRDGQTMVKVNEYVEKGDLLVSGMVDSNAQGIRYVHSFGEVYAETSYKKTGEYVFDYEEKIYTGKERSGYSLSIMGKTLNLYLKEPEPFDYCDRNMEEKEYRTPVSQIPSLFVRRESFKEYYPEKKTRSLEETVELGESDLSRKLNEELLPGAEIINKKVSYIPVGDKGVSVTVEYLCREDIAEQRIIDKTDNLEYDIIEKE